MNKRYLIAVAMGVFFGTGFLCGFLSGYRYAAENFVVEIPDAAIGRGAASEAAASGHAAASDAEADTESIGLAVDDYWMDSDENGLFIAGTVRNADRRAFDAVRVAFDLLDGGNSAYSAVTGTNGERMDPGDSWDFTIYIPYTEMDKFKSFRLQSVMGVRR